VHAGDAKQAMTSMCRAFINFLVPMCDRLEQLVRDGVRHVELALSEFDAAQGTSQRSASARELIFLMTQWRLRSGASLGLLEAACEACRRVPSHHQVEARKLRAALIYVSRMRDQLTGAVTDRVLVMLRAGVHVPVSHMDTIMSLDKAKKQPRRTWDKDAICGQCGNRALWDQRLDWASSHPRLKAYPPAQCCDDCWE